MKRFRPHWRKMTWAVLIFNAIMLIWLITSLTASTKGSCNGLTVSECAGVSDVAHTAVAGIQIVLWVLGDLILGVLWLVTKGRSCPVCGRSVRRGMTVCKSCGHDFAAPAPVAVAQGSSSPTAPPVKAAP